MNLAPSKLPSSQITYRYSISKILSILRLCNLVAGDLVAALSAMFDGWYRAEVQAVDVPGFKVRYIDYGNTETVAKADVRKLTHLLDVMPQV